MKMRAPQEVELTVSEVVGCPKDPPRRVFWDFLPWNFLGLLRRVFRIKPTAFEKWEFARGMQILLELSNEAQQKQAAFLAHDAFRGAKEPKRDPWDLN